MTPEQAQTIYLTARTVAMSEYDDYSKPIRQRECDLRGWQAVLDAHKSEIYRDIALRLIEPLPKEMLG